MPFKFSYLTVYKLIILYCDKIFVQFLPIDINFPQNVFLEIGTRAVTEINGLQNFSNASSLNSNTT